MGLQGDWGLRVGAEVGCQGLVGLGLELQDGDVDYIELFVLQGVVKVALDEPDVGASCGQIMSLD